MLEIIGNPPIWCSLDKPDKSVDPAVIVYYSYPTVARPFIIVEPCLRSVKVILSVYSCNLFINLSNLITISS